MMGSGARDTLEVRPLSKSGRSPSRSPNSKNRKKAGGEKSYASYASDGVTDNNIFALPSLDYRILAFLTIVAAVVRLFRIYQPTSVVFDEVQYVSVARPPISILPPPSLPPLLSHGLNALGRFY